MKNKIYGLKLCTAQQQKLIDKFSANLIIPNFEVVSTTVFTIDTEKIFNIIPPVKTPNFALLFLKIRVMGCYSMPELGPREAWSANS